MAACLYRSFVVDRGVKCQLALRGFERPSTLQPDWNRRGESGLVPCGHPSSHDAEPEDSTCPAYMGPVAGNRIEPVSYVAGLGSRHLFRRWCGRRTPQYKCKSHTETDFRVIHPEVTTR